jgi:hypothetical protein
MLVLTFFGSSVPSLESFWIRLSYLKIQIDMVVYHKMLFKWPVCRSVVVQSVVLPRSTLCLYLGIRRVLWVSVTPRPLSTPGKDPVQETGWAAGSTWMGAENLAPTGIRSPQCQARSQSLHRLSYW